MPMQLKGSMLAVYEADLVVSAVMMYSAHVEDVMEAQAYKVQFSVTQVHEEVRFHPKVVCDAIDDQQTFHQALTQV